MQKIPIQDLNVIWRLNPDGTPTPGALAARLNSYLTHLNTLVDDIDAMKADVAEINRLLKTIQQATAGAGAMKGKFPV